MRQQFFFRIMTKKNFDSGRIFYFYLNGTENKENKDNKEESGGFFENKENQEVRAACKNILKSTHGKLFDVAVTYPSINLFIRLAIFFYFIFSLCLRFKSMMMDILPLYIGITNLVRLTMTSLIFLLLHTHTNV